MVKLKHYIDNSRFDKAVSNNSIILSGAVTGRGKLNSVQSTQGRNYHRKLLLGAQLDPDLVFSNVKVYRA